MKIVWSCVGKHWAHTSTPVLIASKCCLILRQDYSIYLNTPVSLADMSRDRIWSKSQRYPLHTYWSLFIQYFYIFNDIFIPHSSRTLRHNPPGTSNPVLTPLTLGSRKTGLVTSMARLGGNGAWPPGRQGPGHRWPGAAHPEPAKSRCHKPP